MSDLVLGFVTQPSTSAAAPALATFEVEGLRVQPATDGLFTIGSRAFVVAQVIDVVSEQHSLRFGLYLDDELVREGELRHSEALNPIVHTFDLTALDGGDYEVRGQLIDRDGSLLLERRASLALSPRTTVPRPGFTVRRSFDATEPGLLDLTLGDQLWAVGRFDEARHRYERAVDAENDALDMAKWKLAGAYIRSGEAPKAVELLEPLVATYPDQYEVVLGLGLSYYVTARLEDAARFLARAIELKEPGTSLLNALGDVYLRLGQPEKARPLLERSLELDPDQETIREAVGTLPDVRYHH